MKRRVMAGVGALACLLALIGAVWQGISQADLARRQTAYTHCQARVNDAPIKAQNARAVSADQDRDALDQLVSDIIRARSATDTEAALARYQRTRAATDAQRAQHPLPAPPSQAC